MSIWQLMTEPPILLALTLAYLLFGWLLVGSILRLFDRLWGQSWACRRDAYGPMGQRALVLAFLVGWLPLLLICYPATIAIQFVSLGRDVLGDY